MGTLDISRRHWRNFRLYVITAPSAHPGKNLVDVMERTLRGGADILQLRNKTGTREEVLEQAIALRELTRRYGVTFIVNDYPDIAMQVDADGVHLGQEDMSIREARKLVGNNRIIGISTHNIEQAMEAERAGADYIGVGPVFPTETKPGRAAVTTSYVKKAAARVNIPFVAIGGITPDNADVVLAAGARRLCAVSAIVGSEDPEEICRTLLAKLERFGIREESGGIAEANGAIRAIGANGVSGVGGVARTIVLNGRETLTGAATLEELIHGTGQGGKRLIAELDGEIVQRERWSGTALSQGSRVELIAFVGGG